MSKKVTEFIKENWGRHIYHDMTSEGTRIGLPYPYSVPTVGRFDEMYYWDTYFTNKGLEIEGMYDQVKNNTDNILYMIDKFGHMLNANRTYYIGKNSQPPFSTIMVRDVYEHYNDKCWLLGAYLTLKKEYNFWMTERISKIGLNYYGGSPLDDVEELSSQFRSRAGFEIDLSDEEVAKHYVGICESGNDCTPRFDLEIYNFAAVDLNSLLYAFEKNMAYFSEELGIDEIKLWEDRAGKRKELMYKYLTGPDGIMYDYNFEKDFHSKYFGGWSYYPLFTGVADDDYAQLLVNNLHRVEAEYGILSAEKHEIFATYQWDYPYGWAPHQYIVMMGLDKYGYYDDAKRIAQKYMRLVDKVFDETGNLWEKYNVVEGNLNIPLNRSLPPMMGWSAAVYIAANKYLENNDNNK